MSRGVICSGPFIPGMDAGYNVQANGVSINFLKDPFCFRNKGTFEWVQGRGCRAGPSFPDGREAVVLTPLTQVNLLQVPPFLSRERVRSETELLERKVYVPYDGPLYRIKQVKVPVYKEKVKYVSKKVEVEKVYEIPKLEIRDRIQEDLCYVHKFQVNRKMVNCVVEKITPVIPRRFVETLIRIPAISREMAPSMSAGASLDLSNSCLSGPQGGNESIESKGARRLDKSNESNGSNGSSSKHYMSSSNRQREDDRKEHNHNGHIQIMMSPNSSSNISNADGDGSLSHLILQPDKGSDEKFLYSQSLNDITSISSVLPSELLNVRADLLGSKNLSQLISSMDSFTSHETNTRDC